MKFATFFWGNSFKFDEGPPADDYLLALKRVGDLPRKSPEALAAYAALADGKYTSLQKSHALEVAATLARGLRQPDESERLIARIPIPAVQKSAQMQHLLDTGKAPQLLAQFAGENIDAWPFWKRGDGYLARARARLIVKDHQRAEADLSHALEWLAEPRARKAAQDALHSLESPK